MNGKISNILTIDVEDYFMVSAFEQVVKRELWDSYESRVERNTYRILDIMASTLPLATDSSSQDPVSATFFCLGWVAERHPHIIKEIHSRGYEIASHGYDHRMILSMSPESFREDIRKSKAILEDLTGREVIGYRAPSYTITEKTIWALDVLADEGFQYDSSIFPVYHDRYGIPSAPRFPFITFRNGKQSFEYIPLDPKYGALPASGNGKSPDRAQESYNPGAKKPSKALVELPISTLKLFGVNLPVAGGGYFRLLPVELIQWAMRRIAVKEDLPFIFYIHPWELDPGQPRISGLSSRSRFRHYLNLDKTESRFRKMLRTFPFTSCSAFISQNDPARR
jgi:polysaccharide deacetylase family protein (PEP-CTERM system associated)